MSYDTVTIQAQRLGEGGRDFAQRVMQVIVIKNGCDDDDAGDVDAGDKMMVMMMMAMVRM